MGVSNTITATDPDRHGLYSHVSIISPAQYARKLGLNYRLASVTRKFGVRYDSKKVGINPHHNRVTKSLFSFLLSLFETCTRAVFLYLG